MTTIVLGSSLSGNIETLGQLRDAVSHETDGRATEAEIDGYIRSAEARIRRALAVKPVRPMMGSYTFSATADTTSAPPDMVRPFSAEAVFDGRNITVDYVDPEEFANLAVSDGGLAIRRRGCWFFTVANNGIRIFPAPISPVDVTLRYFAKLPALSSIVPSNWLLQDHPDVYLEGACYYAYRAMPDIEKAGLMLQAFEATLAQVVDSYPVPASRARLSVDGAVAAFGRSRFYAR